MMLHRQFCKPVVIADAKILILKQITTMNPMIPWCVGLLLQMQRY